MSKEAPRFHPRAEIPEVPEGMVLVKFYGQPAFIPARQDGEPMFQKSPFTLRQVEALEHLKIQKANERNGSADY